MNATMDQYEGSAPAELTPGEDRNRRRPLTILAIVMVIVAAAALGFYLTRPDANETTTSIERSVVAEFSDDGNLVTDTFDVERGWQIHWETEGTSFAFAITGGFDYGTVIKEKGPGSGVTSPVGSGNFRLEVKAKGPWSVKIIQAEPPPAGGGG
jgi:hypothetical protein